MSQENVEAIRMVYEAMSRGDFWAAREVFDPEIIWEWTPALSGLTGGGSHRGFAGVEAATREFFKPWDRFSQEAEEFIDAGEAVVVFKRMHGRPKGSDLEIEATGADVWTFRDGKVIRFKSFESSEEALEAAGLSE